MAILGIDLGGTKMAIAVLSEQGDILTEETIYLENRKGKEVGALLTNEVKKLVDGQLGKANAIRSIGVSVPGIACQEKDTVWAPNIEGWESYPLKQELLTATGGNIPVSIDNDRVSYIMGEHWKGNAQGCRDAVFIAVGTGIGAGILINGKVLRGAHGIGGAIGWLALERPYNSKFAGCGCFESHASGNGIAKLGRELLLNKKDYEGTLNQKPPGEITAYDIFTAYDANDEIAMEVMFQCTELWGMAVANLVSLFNPEKIIFGGGVFGPAGKFIPAIRMEAEKWAQPVSMQQVKIEVSSLGGRAGVLGAGLLALQNSHPK